MFTERRTLFASREEYQLRMDQAGLTTEICAYRAANESVQLGYGFSISSEEAVRQELSKYNNSPLEVAVDTTSQDIMRHKAEIMCAACGMCVTVSGGYTDMQGVSLSPDDRECPVFEQQ